MMIPALHLLSFLAFSPFVVALQDGHVHTPGDGHDHPQVPVVPLPPSEPKDAFPKLTPVPFDKVKITDRFFLPRIETNAKVSIPAALDQCARTGRLENFAVAAGKPGKHEGALFNDSDVYKVLEGVAYSLYCFPNPELEARADAIIDSIAAAQQPDGYINTYIQLVEPANRWKNMAHGHELYCGGHLIEAGIAYKRVTGKTKLYDVAKKFADLVAQEFGPGKRLDPCGHAEIELALVKLAKESGDNKYLDLCQFFLGQRGNAKGRTLFGDYAQDHALLKDQTKIAGHAVRAMYLYAGAADAAMMTGDRAVIPGLTKIWDDLVSTQMYATGGIGSSAANEGFTEAFDLPNDSAYCESCASIGLALWGQRMMLASGESEFGDVVERALFNNIPASVSIAGDKFFYANPMASRGSDERSAWFGCACCPSNLVRFLPSMSERIFATSGNTLYITQLISAETEVELNGAKVIVRVKSEFPRSGKVDVEVLPDRPAVFAIKLRRPGWCKKAYVQHDLKEREHELDYAAEPIENNQSVGPRDWETFERKYENMDGFLIHFLAPVRREYADPRVKSNQGRVSIQRGPVVYCAEGLDAGGYARSVVIPKDLSFDVAEEGRLQPRTNILRARAPMVARGADGKRTTAIQKITLVPYSQWANRGPGQMVVWFPETPELAEFPGEAYAFDQNGAHIVASFASGNGTLAALNDGVVPKLSSDSAAPRHAFWPHKGGQEWIVYEFEAARPVSSAAVLWFDDTGTGECRLPKAWHVEYKDGKTWKPMTLAAGAAYGIAKDTFAATNFEPVTTNLVRLVVEQAEGMSSGVLEWEVK